RFGGLVRTVKRMHRPTRTVTTRCRWLFTVIAYLAVAAQAVVAFAPLLEGRDGRLASHVEAPGPKTHVAAHNEATCASCQARSIHSTSPRAAIAPCCAVITPTAVIGDLASAIS